MPEGYAFLGFPELGSTSDFARDMAKDWFAEHEDSVWVWTAVQTAGRGRRGREWQSRAGNFSATLLMRPNCDAKKGAELSFVAALAIADTLQALSPVVPVELKWPNDVLLGGKKVSGILLESQATPGERLDWLSIGCGVNLAFHPDDTPYPATSLAASGLPVPDPLDFLEGLSTSFAKRLWSWENDGFARIRADWLKRAKGIGETIEARLGEQVETGIFKDLDEQGALVLERADGSIRKVTAGEVFFV